MYVSKGQKDSKSRYAEFVWNVLGRRGQQNEYGVTAALDRRRQQHFSKSPYEMR